MNENGRNRHNSQAPGAGPAWDRWTVEPATVVDAPYLARLRWEFRTEVAGDAAPIEEAARFLIRCGDWMSARLERSGAWRAWCGRASGLVVGTAWAQLVEKIPNPVAERELLGYVSSVYVRPEMRGRGMGKALTGAAVDWCRRAGAVEVVLWATPASEPMYSRLEFQPATCIFSKALPAPPPVRQAVPAPGNRGTKIQVVNTTLLS